MRSVTKSTWLIATASLSLAAGANAELVPLPPQPSDVPWPTAEWPTGPLPESVDAAALRAAMDDEISPRIRELCTARMIDRARILGALMRVAYLVSAAMPDVLPRAPLTVEAGQVVLELPQDLAPLASDRLFNRLRQLARLIGRTPVIRVGQGATGGERRAG